MANQGRNGQWRFANLCTAPEVSTEAVVNPAVDDQHGWDHMLEITPPQDTALPADLRTQVISCFVQIKTTSGKKTKTKVKLSNALKAAKSPLPSFIFLFHFQKSGEPILYGKHIWKDEIRLYLKRGRQADGGPLHRKTVTVQFHPEDRLACNPVDWVLAVLASCGGDAYTLAKRRYVNTVGYETETHTGNMQLGPLNSHSDVVLHEIGVLADLPVTSLKIFDTRFGIGAKTPSEDWTGGRVSFSSDGRPVVVKLQSCEGDVLELPGRIWAPSVVPMENPEFRIRVKSGYIDIIIKPQSIRDGALTYLNFQFNLHEERPFIDQIGLLALSNWSVLGPVSVMVEVESGQLFVATIDLDMQPKIWMKEFWVCARYLLGVLEVKHDRTPEVSFWRLHGFLRDQYALALLHESNSIRFEGRFEHGLVGFEKLVGYSYGQLGDWTFGAIHELKVEAQSHEGQKFTVQLARPKIVHKFAFVRSLQKTVDQIRRDFDTLLSRQTVAVATFDKGDLFEWSRSHKSNKTVAIQIHEPAKPS